MMFLLARQKRCARRYPRVAAMLGLLSALVIGGAGYLERYKGAHESLILVGMICVLLIGLALVRFVALNQDDRQAAAAGSAPRWYRVRPGYWFAPKRYGFGAVPVRWQGWALMTATLLVAGAISKLTQRDVLYQLLFIPLFASALWLCWVKTDGGWRWRWGDKD